MSSKFRVRFAPPPKLPSPHYPPTPSTCETSLGRKAPKSRQGCRECKRRRVKCDETYPVCLRCQRSGSVCEPPPRPQKWQSELPWMSKQTMDTNLNIDKRLLLYWCERASHIMCVDPDLNTMSFPIIPLLQQSQSLAHVLQGVCVAHEHFFHASATCLEEQSRALELLQLELMMMQNEQLISCFLAVYMLGLLAGWLGGQLSDYGKEHLSGARAIIDMIISSPLGQRNEFTHFAVGAYLYWDMACSFLLEPEQQMPLNTPEMYTAVQSLGDKCHPIVGHSMDMFYLLGTLGRYCRLVVESGVRDFALETTLEEQLLQWEPVGEQKDMALLTDAFRLHGLINLYRICGSVSDGQDDTSLPVFSQSGDGLKTRIRLYSLRIIRGLLSISASSSYTNEQAIPLLTAGAELTDEDEIERFEVKGRLEAIYSFNRLPANLMAIELLQDLWALRDAGTEISWLELMLQKGWRLMMG